MTAEELYGLLEERFDDVRRYSGRGMYGRECPAFVVSEANLLGEIGSFVAFIETRSVRVEVAGLLYQAKTDQMGLRDAVVYFPRLKFEEPEAA